MDEDNKSSTQISAPDPFTPANLERISVDEMRAYIGSLQREIERVEQEIDKRESHRTGAEALFKI